MMKNQNKPAQEQSTIDRVNPFDDFAWADHDDFPVLPEGAIDAETWIAVHGVTRPKQRKGYRAAGWRTFPPSFSAKRQASESAYLDALIGFEGWHISKG
jgi:hypothetical protein